MIGHATAHALTLSANVTMFGLTLTRFSDSLKNSGFPCSKRNRVDVKCPLWTFETKYGGPSQDNLNPLCETLVKMSQKIFLTNRPIPALAAVPCDHHAVVRRGRDQAKASPSELCFRKDEKVVCGNEAAGVPILGEVSRGYEKRELVNSRMLR